MRKSVCISIHSTAQCKYWNHKNGWNKIVKYLQNKKYNVKLINKEKGNYMGNVPPKGIIDKTGNFSLEDRIKDLRECDFFIGTSSGLSWLAWAVGVPVILISGHTDPFYEFQYNCIRLNNESVCHGCWHNTYFNKGDWKWCPEFKNFECTKAITPDHVINAIDNTIDKIDNINYNKNNINDTIETEDVWSYLLTNYRKYIKGDILEIGPGYGRITRHLERNIEDCGSLLCVEVNPQIIKMCKDRFKIANFFVNNGISLDMINNYSIDFIISWDSFTHMNYYVIKDYMSQIYRKLKSGGYGLINHNKDIDFKDLCESNKLIVLDQTIYNGNNVTLFKTSNFIKPPFKYQDIDYNDIFIRGDYEHDKCIVEQDDIVVDIGANIGVFSNYAISKGANIVYSIEPEIENLKCLLKNIPNKCIPFNIGIYNENTYIDLYVDAYSGGHSILEKNNTKTGEVEKVKVMTLDNFIETYEIKRIDFLKIDTEGAESAIFEGLSDENLLKINKIAMEYHHNADKHPWEKLKNRLEKWYYWHRTEFIGGGLSMIYFWRK